MSLVLLLPIVFLIAVIMTMAGRGGGNFYVLLQVFAGVSMQQAAATGQFIMCFTSVAALVVFQKHRNISWRMALFIGMTTSLMAFVGGVTAHLFEGNTLKLVFATLLVLASLLMLYPVTETVSSKPQTARRNRWQWSFESGGAIVQINLLYATPVALVTGFFSGMVGVSGGSFLIPLMVLACCMPMRLAVGTASVMVSATAAMGFLGHLVQGGIDWPWAMSQAGVAVLGGLIGGKLALVTRPRLLKGLFAITTLAAAILMYWKALTS